MSWHSAYKKHQLKQQEVQAPFIARVKTFAVYLFLFLVAVFAPALIDSSADFSKYVAGNTLLIFAFLASPAFPGFKFIKGAGLSLIVLVLIFFLLPFITTELFNLQAPLISEDFNTVAFGFSMLYFIAIQTLAMIVAEKITGIKLNRKSSTG